MKIEQLSFPNELTEPLGLKPVFMNRLSNIVLLAGKNGAGKTRFLELLKTSVSNYPTEIQLGQAESNINLFNNALKVNKINPESDKPSTVAEKQQKQISYNNGIKEANLLISKQNLIKFSEEKKENPLISFVPKSLDLKDSYTSSSADIERNAKNIYSIGMQHIADGTISAIEIIQKKWINVKSTQDLDITSEEIIKINEDYEKLKLYIKTFLNTDLKRNKEGHPLLFDKRIGETKLSDGQKILLQFCIALFAQENNLENLIILMDEPENHLHPASLIEVLDKIVPHVTNGQIWIATHSINVLAHFDPSNIWYIDKGEISYAGNLPRTVLEGLLGDDEEIEKLSNFLALPAQMASNNFAFESLFYPNVLITGPEDPQIIQIHDIIKDRALKGDKIKVLDFGIGKGRLMSTIYENERLRNSNTIDWLDFYGYDIFDTHKEICNKVFVNIYGNFENRYFNEAKDILAKHDENTFDFIVMCNVFHEIEPKDWLNLFNSVTSLFKLLKEDGYLLIIEDQFLAVGEKAHSKGFIIFDELEFKKLFKITSNDKYLSTDYRKDGRLKSHHIPKNCINRIDATSKKEALQVLLQNSKDKIKSLRKETNPSFKTGKLHGFWAQQLANTLLALEEL